MDTKVAMNVRTTVLVSKLTQNPAQVWRTGPVPTESAT